MNIQRAQRPRADVVLVPADDFPGRVLPQNIRIARGSRPVVGDAARQEVTVLRQRVIRILSKLRYTKIGFAVQ